MKFRTLIRRSLRHHWRSHLGVVLGAAIGSAALIGALVVGDSVRESLKKRAMLRLGFTSVALDADDRVFGDDLLERMSRLAAIQARFPATNSPSQLVWKSGFSVSALRLRASVARQDGQARANQVRLFGVPDMFLELMRSGRATGAAGSQESGLVWINDALAKKLSARVGDDLLVRFQKPSTLSYESPISTRNDSTVVMRLRVAGMATWPLAALDLESGAAPPLNAFISSDDMTETAGLAGKANLMLVDPAFQTRKMNRWDSFKHSYAEWRRKSGPHPFQNFGWFNMSGTVGYAVDDRTTIEVIKPLFDASFKLSDAGLEWMAASNSVPPTLELRTTRIFLDEPIIRAAFAGVTNSQPILTYLVNLLHAGTNTTPYSMVTAAGAPWTSADMRDDEIIVSQWLAEDLRVKPGDEIAMSYFLPESGARLEEGTNRFRVRAIVPLEMPWADRTLMPDFPGIEKAESTSDWDAGFPLVHEIRKKDDDYWKKYRGTPKAFVTLAAGQKMWANRFGNLTAIRFPIPTNALPLTPALSPSEGERENRPQSPSNPKTADGSTASKKSGGGQQLLPLPGGEGRGEGERKTHTNQSEPPHVVAYKNALERKILANLKPEELGLRFEPVREQALKAAEESQDFGGLFLGFSFFLILAALLLMAMLFQFGLEQRAPEIGTLLALGFTPKQVRKLLLREGVALSLVGGIIGTLGGVGYAKAMLHGLTTVWRDAVGASSLSFHITGQTLVIGLLASVVVGAITIWLTLRKFVKRPARELLVGEIGAAESKVQSLKSKVIGATALLAGVALVGWAMATGDTANAGIFFGAGALVLVAGLSFSSAWLAGLERGTPVRRDAEVGVQASACSGDTLKREPQRAELEFRAPITMTSLAVRGCARRRKRSLGTIAMLACGSFLIVSIGVFRLDANRDASKKESGTGGFALIGETTMPVVHDLNSQSGRDFFALNERDFEGVSVVQFRVREGDEASCLNLNAAQRPRLLGVKPGMLAGRFSFAKSEGWRSLINTGLQPGDRASLSSGNRLSGFSTPPQAHTGLKPGVNEIEIPAIGDANSIQWAMHKKVGDTIDYVDERGQPFKVRVVGAVANSILQGQLIIDEAEFVKCFPSESGYRMFLLDAPSNSVSQLSATLSRAMQDVGLELTPAAQRLAQFNAVQNTYLGTFQVLGGLGLLLGSAGLGIVVLRNALERRGELAVLMAVGFRKAILQKLLLIENGALLLAGLALGIVAAGVAVLPALLSPSAELPLASLALTLGAVLVNGALWTWVATRFAVRGNLLAALRNE